MLVVSNTSPILNLAIVGQLALMRQQFEQIKIPPAVLEELRITEELSGSRLVREAIAVGWIQVREVRNQSLVQVLQQTLLRGEAEAIALAMELQAKWTLLDERDGRKVAKSLGLKVTEVLRILLRAREMGKLSNLQEVIQNLTDSAGFRIAPELLAPVIDESQPLDSQN